MSVSYSETTPDNESPNKPRQIRINIPPRFYLLPGTAILLGTTIGLFRGSRRASLRFLAENVHRPPTTVQGWYFYQKTKNYRVILGGLKEAGADALKLGASAAAWVCFEEGATRLGEEVANFKEIIAGLGTSAVFSLACECSRPDLLVRLNFSVPPSRSSTTESRGQSSNSRPYDRMLSAWASVDASSAARQRRRTSRTTGASRCGSRRGH
ncbi:uncharacterized protein PHACADRAFT_249398 [Phanerochaete carnosa HHB-10118-sp]|uniref:Uncharacterized protein n=1 Tax=Phanerochaete carnosa (strain HHB-10118-sp) TaxID=650164 RepID=K5WIE6_PHACS|nr:uncharacterized protein PHACADRAFT_249398 [Phanerochaete carnosa HHB-10118-sp]EKM59150.1 hypothetical protein PHACADRAFT_249398 [Phanerochaete carnosa HHB-10118-sp]